MGGDGGGLGAYTAGEDEQRLVQQDGSQMAPLLARTLPPLKATLTNVTSVIYGDADNHGDITNLMFCSTWP